MPSELLLAFAFWTAVPPVGNDGFIGGMVVNGTQQMRSVAGTKVVLQLKSDGEFMLLDEASTDATGRFLFRDLLVSEHVEYKVGTNHQDIHYPGPHIRLTPAKRKAYLQLVVRDTVHEPNPLVVRAHDIRIESDTGMLRVTESLVIENPTASTYVGPIELDAETEPTTLQLSIPSDFQKVTFFKEFFGRAFALHDGKLVTSIPWEPGKRELKFTYVLRNTKQHRVWERPLDLPTDHVRLQVKSDAPDEVACDLGAASLPPQTSRTDVLFETGEGPLAAPQTIRVELGRLQVPWMVYGRRVAIAILVAVAGAGLIRRRRRSRQPGGTANALKSPSPPAEKQPIVQGGRPRKRRLRRAA